MYFILINFVARLRYLIVGLDNRKIIKATIQQSGNRLCSFAGNDDARFVQNECGVVVSAVSVIVQK